MEGYLSVLLIIDCIIFIYLIITNHFYKLYNVKEENFSESEVKGYAIYKGSGGMSHMLRAINSTIEDCIKNRKNLVIDTKCHDAFDGDFFNYFYIVGHGDINIGSNYPKKYKWKDIPIEEIEKSKVHFTKKGYKLVNDKAYFLDTKITKGDNINLISPISKTYPTHIKLKKDHIDKLKRQTKDLEGDFIGVHYRNTDYKTDYNSILKQINDTIKKNGIKKVYLATDDYNAYDKFKKDVKGEVVRKTYPKKLDKGQKNIHYTTKDKSKVVNDCLLDMYALTKSKHFIQSKISSLSQIINFFRKNPNNSIFSE